MWFENLNSQAESGTAGGRDRATVCIVASSMCCACTHASWSGLPASRPIRCFSATVQSSQPGFYNPRGGLKLLRRNAATFADDRIGLLGAAVPLRALGRPLACRKICHFAFLKEPWGLAIRLRPLDGAVSRQTAHRGVGLVCRVRQAEKKARRTPSCCSPDVALQFDFRIAAVAGRAVAVLEAEAPCRQ